MAHKQLFAPASRVPLADTINEAGGKGYAFSPEHALSQYAVTGTFNQTFYAQAEEQLERTLALCSAVSPEFIAKTAIHARERGFMKDMPALLAAVLAAKDVRLLCSVFHRVIDTGKMLRNFVQIIRSGVVGRKSFGSAPRRLCQEWFARRSPDDIFRQSLGRDPSMADVIKMVRPKPSQYLPGQPAKYRAKDVTREALYGYLIDKQVIVENLPPMVRAFEKFKKAATGTSIVPAVPFEMLTALPLDRSQWSQIAESMTWTQTRMNLNTLARHGVFSGKRSKVLTSKIEDRLRDPALVRKARAFPYQLLTAFGAASADIPPQITLALQQAMEIAIENVPALSSHKIFLCPDVSGSMRSPVTGRRAGSTTATRCIDVAALIAAAFLRRNPSAEVIPFSDDVVPLPHPINPLDSVMTNASLLAALPSGGTACSAPLVHLNAQDAKGDLVVYVSDNMSWADFGRNEKHKGHRGRSTVMAKEWDRFAKRNPGAKLVLIDLQPNASTQVQEQEDVLNVGGFSDSVFELVALFSLGELGSDHWVREIERIVL